MNIQHLRYVVEVAKTGSLNKAAETLFIAQPNLSRAIKELEKDINIVIFERTAKGMRLTADGEKFITDAQKVLHEIDEMERSVKEYASDKKRFSVSVPRAGYIGEAFSEFSLRIADEKDVEIIYNETNALNTIRNIIEENYRLGIIRYSENYESQYAGFLEKKEFMTKTVTEFRYVLIMNKNCPLTLFSDIKYENLVDYIEIVHADPYVPSVPLDAVKKDELPYCVRRRICVFDRASQYEILAKNTDAFMWASPVSEEILERYGLVQKVCDENQKYYRDILIYKKGYKFTELDKAFERELFKSKSKFITGVERE